MSSSSNNYTYQKCFVAFLDILGFKRQVLESQHRTEKIKILVDSLKLCGGFPSGGKKVVQGSVEKRVVDIRSRFFSDSLLFFLKESPQDLAQLFFAIRYLQDRLWEQKICLRGAVTIHDMYWLLKKENNIALGPGLIEAYNLESESAVFPRIVVSDTLSRYIERENCTAEPFGMTDQLRAFIRRDDNDGVQFLDLLNRDVTRALG